MNKFEKLEKIKFDLKDKLNFLDDKPEETLDSTIKALWFAALGILVSAEKANDLTLPDLSESEEIKLNQLIALRLNNIPLAYITKRQCFMGIDFIVDQRALIPRKETEILAKKAIELSREISKSRTEINIIDVCCGSGNLGIAISCFNNKCKVYVADISNDAIELAKENVNFLNQNERVSIKQSDLFTEFDTNEFYGKADLIVCNPPYISSTKVLKMNAEIASNEPSLAFDGGQLGIKIIHKLIIAAPKFIKPGGWLIFEIGVGQGDFVYKMIEKTKFYQKIETESNESGKIRIIMAQK